MTDDLEDIRAKLDWLMSRVPVRDIVAQTIFDGLSAGTWGNWSLEGIDLQHDQRGPLGGRSSQIICLVKDSKKELNRVIINVYCDDNTNAPLREIQNRTTEEL